MKFTVASKTLYSFVTVVNKVINNKNAIAVLNNFYMELRGDKLTIKASDTDNSLIGVLDVTEVEGEGSFCIDARRMVEMLKDMPPEGITFDINEENMMVTVTYSNGYFNTMAISGDEYPSMTIVDTDLPADQILEFTATADQVIKGTELTSFACSTDEIRPQMTGVLWDVKTDKIIFVATDTRKLVRYINSEGFPGVEGSFILPYKPAVVLKNILAGAEAVTVTATPKSVRFSTQGYTFDCRLINGNYPDYNRVIPHNNPYVLNIDRVALLDAVRRVSGFVESNNGRVTFSISNSSVVLEAKDSSYNTSGRESVECEYNGPDLNIAFSGPYLMEILGTMNAKDLVVKFADQSRPALFMPAEQADDSELLMILMPMYL